HTTARGDVPRVPKTPPGALLLKTTQGLPGRVKPRVESSQPGAQRAGASCVPLAVGHRTTQRSAPMLSRRDLLKTAGASALGCGWLGRLAASAARDPQRKRACILLWMAGGPSQTDTFDPKPGHANGGPFKATPTAAPGVTVAEHLPGVAAQMK